MKSDKLIYSDHLPKHIKKGHQLVFSRQDLSAREADLLALMMAFMKPDDWDNATPNYNFPCSKLSEWLGIEAKHVGSVLAPIAERLSLRQVGIKSLDDSKELEFEYVPLFKRIQYKNSVLKIVPNDELKSEYIEYHKGFALINTTNFLGLKREYSKRLYELLSRFKNGGTTMKSYPVEELKGLFGILDEHDRLKADKISFANTGVFMARCIRESIHELMENKNTKKELLFLPSDSKTLGYKVKKIGNRIVEVEFLYQWVSGTTTIDTLNVQDAKNTIRKLETARLQNKKSLLDEELELLASAYKSIGHDAKALQILDSLAERKFKEKNVLINEENDDDDLDSFLNKIQILEDVSGNPEY